MAAKKKLAKSPSKAKVEIDLEGAQDTGGPSVNPFEAVILEPEAEPIEGNVHHDDAIDTGASPEAPVFSSLDLESSAYEPEHTGNGVIDDGGEAPNILPEDFSDFDAISDQVAVPASVDIADGGTAALGEMVELQETEMV